MISGQVNLSNATDRTGIMPLILDMARKDITVTRLQKMDLATTSAKYAVPVEWVAHYRGCELNWRAR